MLTVTDTAAQYLRETLSRKEEGAPAALRIVYSEEGYQLTLDDPKEGDQVYEHEGESYLLLDSEVGEALSDASLDVQDSPQGVRLTLAAGSTPEPQSEPEPESEA
jgi:Fe-S cluster assembly iron-binding protein IscA